MTVFLGIDIGTSGTKTIAIDSSGKVLAEASQSYPCYHPKPLWSEQDPEDWWQAVISTVGAVIKKADLDAHEVKAIGLSGQMHGAVFLDSQNNVVRPAILWNDQRSYPECGEIESKVGGRQKLVEMVANPALAGFTAPKILWLRNHEPANFEKTKKILLPKDEIRRRLTGEFATDLSDASGMLLLDVKNRSWSKPLLEKLQLDQQLFAPCFESPQVTGRLSKQAAQILGLSESCVVVAGAGDCAASAVGNGIVTPGAVSTLIGTSGVVFAHADEAKFDPEGRLHTFCHAVPGKWHMMGVNLSAGGCLQWFRNTLCRSEMEGQEKNIYALLDQEAASVPTGADGLFFLPYLSGERTPHANAHARACFVGLTMSHRRGHMVRAIMEGVTYNLRESLEIIRGLSIPVEEIRAGGGGSQSQLWLQMQADVFGHEVVTLQNEYGAANGAALLAAVGGGAFASVQEACSSTIARANKIRHSEPSCAFYNRSFPIYQSLYKNLFQAFEQISLLEREPALAR